MAFSFYETAARYGRLTQSASVSKANKQPIMKNTWQGK